MLSAGLCRSVSHASAACRSWTASSRYSSVVSNAESRARSPYILDEGLFGCAAIFARPQYSNCPRRSGLPACSERTPWLVSVAMRTIFRYRKQCPFWVYRHYLIGHVTADAFMKRPHCNAERAACRGGLRHCLPAFLPAKYCALREALAVLALC